MTDKTHCLHCGRPVLPTSWYSRAVGNCRERALGLDCMALEKLKARRAAAKSREESA